MIRPAKGRSIIAIGVSNWMSLGLVFFFFAEGLVFFENCFFCSRQKEVTFLNNSTACRPL